MSIRAAAVLTGLCVAGVAHAADSLTERAVKAFDTVCLANASSLSAARSAAVAEPWSFKRGESLPSLVNGPMMETYKSGDVELLFRPNRKSGFGCFVAFTVPDQTTNDDISAEISKLPSLTLANPGKGKEYRATWQISAAPNGSKVYLTIHDTTPRSPLLNLESKGTLD